MTTIIFIRDQRKGRNEISGYIDLAHRLKTEDFRQIFEGKKMLMPKPTDLSFFNWDAQYATLNDSPNFRVDANSDAGLLFRNKRDRKVINVDPNKDPPGDGTKRVEIECSEYTQVVFFDHITRRKH
uniref:Cilia- and flagella-associated protein 299 n=1 Tax=Strombidium inclinatum TaxID=197538 RepID=A0A7S3IQ90_9SPIT|mmetsp:Transcript_33434/g.51328  ORF Transcript_33434/g.51328 Transcript_33434/m.51328 type:complete len:126 (+) Transcript_33434:336-713(+)